MKIESVEVCLIQDERLFNRYEGELVPTLMIDGAHLCTIACLVYTDEGIVGEGYGWAIGARRGRLVTAAVREVAGLMVGRDPRRIEALWEVFWGFSNFLGHSGLSIIGMSVLDMALWDVACKASGVPLWLALGGHKERTPVYSSHLHNFYGARRLRAKDVLPEAEALVERGHTSLKFWVRTPDELGTFRELVEHFDPPVRWALDVVQVWDAHTAIRAGASLEDLDLFWIEDPVPYDDISGLARVARSLKTPICAGENAYYIHEARRLLEETEVRYLSLDLQRCGGITGWRKIAALAEAHNVSVASHVYTHVAVHLLCGTRNGAYCEVYPEVDGIVGRPLEVDAGYATPPSAPGIGVEFPKEVLAAGVAEVVRG